MTIFLTVLHVMVCIVLIAVVLLQRGKGAEIGAVFGGGASSTVFGSRGAGNFLTKLTTGAAVVFMCTSLTLAYFARERAGTSIFEETDAPAAEAPAEPSAGGFGEVGEAVPLPEALEPGSGAPEVELAPEAEAETPGTAILAPVAPEGTAADDAAPPAGSPSP
jgi:preprotein translocase subunit SecG